MVNSFSALWSQHCGYIDRSGADGVHLHNVLGEVQQPSQLLNAQHSTPNGLKRIPKDSVFCFTRRGDQFVSLWVGGSEQKSGHRSSFYVTASQCPVHKSGLLGMGKRARSVAPATVLKLRSQLFDAQRTSAKAEKTLRTQKLIADIHDHLESHEEQVEAIHDAIFMNSFAPRDESAVFSDDLRYMLKLPKSFVVAA
eukprot:6382626-Amphidinium_carterae.1